MESTPATETAQAEQSLPAALKDTLGGMIATIAEVDRAMASLAAMRAELVNQAAQWNDVTSELLSGDKPTEMSGRAFRAELACALRIPERTAENLIGMSRVLTQRLPATVKALSDGEISYRHAQIMVDHLAGLDEQTAASLEAASLPFARNLTAAKFDRKLRTMRERAVPESMVERRKRAEGDRDVTLSPGQDGMAWLTAYLPAHVALGAYNRLTEMARALKCADDDRTLMQRRADVFRDLVLDAEPSLGGARGVRPTVFVTVPVLALLGHTDEPATLDGYGPIDTETARELAAEAPSFIRLLTHPETGAVLSVGRESYRVPTDLRNWLRVRDGTCRFPGCSRHAAQCDVDHTDDWLNGGQTAHDNLAHLCRGHHTLKHNSGWSVLQVIEGHGILAWTSPCGYTYTTEPELRLSA